MGDSEEKIQEIEYSPEELEEINRIVDLVQSTFSGAAAAEPPPPAEPSETDFDGAEEPEEFEDEFDFEEPEAPDFDLGEEYVGEPSDLDLPSGDLDSLTTDELEETGAEPEVPVEGFSLDSELPMEEIDDLASLEDIDVADEVLPDEVSGEDTEEIEDITDMIEEVDEAGAPPADEFPELEDISELPEEVPAEEAPSLPEEAAVSDDTTPLEQLDALTLDEPESLDEGDLAPDDEFVDEGGIPEIDLGDEGATEEAVEAATGPEADTVSIGDDAGVDIPDLSDLTLEEPGEIEEAGDEDIPDLDLGGIGDEEPADEGAPEPLVTDELDEIEDLGAMAGFEDEPSLGEDLMDTSMEDEPMEGAEEFMAREPGLPDISDDGIAEEEPLQIEPLDDESFEEPLVKPVESPAAPAEEGGVEITDRDLKKLKKVILLFNPALISEIKDSVINDRLSGDDTGQLVDMIISGRPEDSIRKFLEKKLNKKIVPVDETGVPGRRVITARPEYSLEGRERQKRLLRATRIGGVAALAAVVFTLVGYQFIYKPYMAKKKIQDGVALILRSGDYVQKPKDYAEAENIFDYVDEHYRKDYIYGYNAYGRAYFDRKEWDRSIDKLNEAYSIDYNRNRSISLDTLNNLGYFYSRVPGEYFNAVGDKAREWYYPERRIKDEPRDQLDLAIEFYRRVLARDKDNTEAMYGIGNSYYFQGQYLKAKKYYEDILKIDSSSVVGFSGLLNLYIERDSFEQVVSIDSSLRDKKIMEKMPPPLLAKLASYYLDKTQESNVRIEYGVQSPRYKDADDKLYPAVRSVLLALSERNPEYPPLHLQFARLHKAQNNLKQMKIYLDRAVEYSQKNYDADYFGALHLLGEYYYETKDPVRAYEFLNRAIRANSYQPAFVREDFYHETETPGESYALLGNIFYYFFDKIQARYGDLEEEVLDSEMDKMANFAIARDKYESAINEGFESPELHYNLGRIYYLNSRYRDSLDQWLHLYEDFVTHPELMFALGNAFYHLGNYEAGKGEYLKLISYYENEAEQIRMPSEGNTEHIKIFNTLASAYNNLGAIYQLQNNEGKSSISYWKAIDYADRINRENQFARVNLARSFKDKSYVVDPILDENIPYSIDVYREYMR